MITREIDTENVSFLRQKRLPFHLSLSTGVYHRFATIIDMKIKTNVSKERKAIPGYFPDGWSCRVFKIQIMSPKTPLLRKKERIQGRRVICKIL